MTGLMTGPARWMSPMLMSLGLHLVVIGGCVAVSAVPGSSKERPEDETASKSVSEYAETNQVSQTESPAPIETPVIVPEPEKEIGAVPSSEVRKPAGATKPAPERKPVRKPAPAVASDAQEGDRLPVADDLPEPVIRSKAPTAENAGPATYVVKAGDTLTKISRVTGLSPAQLAALNKKSVSQLAKLWVGQKLKLR